MAMLLVLVLAGCDSVGIALDTFDHSGTVYNCGGEVEYCFTDDSAEELSDLVGLTCHEATLEDRWFPGVTNALGLGCRYICPPPPEPGCNSHNGCLCP